ncbi:hypothetical protein BCR43DRAFT_66584 [Syncephalastrum racemosum]|uniref:Uncharacterized protein n=1 Tax=Syncephalastrum racemosum TaxID=13706 RepID=A0A1X2HWB7_SYNRA|nr:hypothetical protein BCR43DRAFT_66584 [Syncephalastrum racemosum]
MTIREVICLCTPCRDYPHTRNLYILRFTLAGRKDMPLRRYVWAGGSMDERAQQCIFDFATNGDFLREFYSLYKEDWRTSSMQVLPRDCQQEISILFYSHLSHSHCTDRYAATTWRRASLVKLTISSFVDHYSISFSLVSLSISLCFSSVVSELFFFFLSPRG